MSYFDFDEAVFSIPVDFSARARKELLEAAEHVGIKVKGFVSESSSAYISKVRGIRAFSKAMVIDFGSGTLDSYATYFLMAMRDQGVIQENFDGCDYNGRIKLFNKYISAEDFEGISYFIVDEIQDLVNERAEMVLKILKNLKCGYLLAGDRCQSIYDYEADDDATLDSVKFYELAESLFPDDMLRYEIAVNRRQSAELAEEATKMRRVLLGKSFIEQNKYANSIVSKYSGKTKIEHYVKTLIKAPTVSTATAVMVLDFNSHAPRGARRAGSYFEREGKRFQLTRPSRGATFPVSYIGLCYAFQLTRPSRGAAKKTTTFEWSSKWISTHTPLAGCDAAV